MATSKTSAEPLEGRERSRGRRRPLTSLVGPPLIDATETSRNSSPKPLLTLNSRPSMPWGIGSWVMDLSMYEPPDEVPPIHVANRTTWPRAFLDYKTNMDDETLISRGDAIAHLIRRESEYRTTTTTTQREAKPDLRKTYDSAHCLYVVHACIDLNASFEDVLAVLNEQSFLSHVFGHQMVASTQVREAGPRTKIQKLTLHVPRGYKRHQAMEVMYLDHVVADRTSWTQAMKSIDSADASTMQHLLCGFHLESQASQTLQPRCRLTYYGDSCMPSVLAVKTDGANYFLDAFGQSMLLVQRIVRRRRKQNIASSLVPEDSGRRVGHKRCRLCTKSFHLFRHAHSCRVCLSRVCADCSDIEEIDSADGLYVDDVVRICHGCHATTNSSPVGSPSQGLTMFQPMACHVCLNPFRPETQVQCCKVCDQNGCATSCGIFDEMVDHIPKQNGRGMLWTCRRCLVPVRRSLSANYFSTLEEDENVDGMAHLMYRRASFD